ncbi:MAG: RHS repeat-associated core domain-containing protein [Chloroflexota bacterium]
MLGTGLRARMYDPSIGRFLQRDVLRRSGRGIVGLNRFVYTGSGPVSRTDPSGLCEDPGGDGTRICIETYIPMETAWGFVGDNRGPRSDGGTYRTRQQFSVTAEGQVRVFAHGDMGTSKLALDPDRTARKGVRELCFVDHSKVLADALL